jgi:lipoate-protein ligase A
VVAFGVNGRRHWRLLETGQGSPEANMALDCAIQASVASGAVPPTIRVYTWDRVAVSLGRFQDPRTSLRLDYVVKNRITVVRRPTGGRGVLHGHDLTLSVACPVEAIQADNRSVMGVHARIMGGIVSGLRSLGYAATIGRGRRAAERSGDCFASACGADVVGPDGSKYAGGAQRRLGDTVLQQISVAWRPHGVRPDDVFTGPAQQSGFPLKVVDEEALVSALANGLAMAFHAELEHGTLTEEEQRLSAELAGTHAVDLAELM